jgi:hypothetical protein
MPRVAKKRRPNEADLTERQRRIYASLSDELREEYLKDLPLISISTAGNRKKAQQIRDRLRLVDNTISQLQEHKTKLAQLAKDLDQGRANASDVDLRTALKPPAINGVSMRYVRSPKE